MSALRRVVFDTSTLVSAALRVDSLPQRALAHALAAGEVCGCASTLAELERVLRRAKFDQYQTTEIRSEFVAMLRRLVILVAVSAADESDVSPFCRDLKDNKFLALIKVSGADALISSDADLLVLHPWQGVPILTPAAYVALMNA